jgi:hypothetical protein
MQKIIMYLLVTLQSIIENMQVIGDLKNEILERVGILFYLSCMHFSFQNVHLFPLIFPK